MRIFREKNVDHIKHAIDCVNGVNLNGVNYKIRLSSNEPLFELFSKVSVENKEVLAVLSSGDHYFYADKFGAKSVDAFDINPLTYYYSKLREYWMCIYHQFYFDAKTINNEDSFKYFLNQVKELNSEDSEEFEEVCKFWYGYISQVSPEKRVELFYESYMSSQMDSYAQQYSLPKKMIFFEQDLAGKLIIDKEYDVVFPSNIIEGYALDQDGLIAIRNNLSQLLKKDGMIVCSCCCGNATENALELGNFNELFECSSLYSLQIPQKKIGYQLSKRC